MQSLGGKKPVVFLSYGSYRLIFSIAYCGLHRRLVTNSSDRTLRQFNLPAYPPPNVDREYIEQELEPTHRFNDPINKTAWHAMSYSPDGEWLAGGNDSYTVITFSFCLGSCRVMQAQQILPLTKYTYGIFRTTDSSLVYWTEDGSPWYTYMSVCSSSCVLLVRILPVHLLNIAVDWNSGIRRSPQ